jgi:SNF2 family DNA or RNA helicase
VVVLGRDNGNDLLKLPLDRFRTVVIDELSGYKGRGARWKTMKKVTDVPHVWGLTGTPASNGLMDLWPQVYLLDRGERLGRSVTMFRSRFFTPGRQLPNGTIIEWNLREGAEEKIFKLIDDICLSMETDGRVQLPGVTYNPISVELPEDVKKVYRRLKEKMVVDLRELFGGEVHTAKNAAILTSKLSQISAGFLFVDDQDIRRGKYVVLHREKMKAAREVVESVDSPMMIAYRFIPERKMLQEEFPEARLITEKGAIEDWNAGRVPVMLAHPASAGHGLNLQHGGHHLLWTSLDWSLELWEQMNKRLNRSGQQHPVVIHTLMTNRAVDHLIKASLTGKAVVQDSLLAHLESPI